MKKRAPLLIVLAVSTAAAALAAGVESKEVKRSFPLSRDGRVSVETFKGSVTVQAFDRPEVEIAARIEADESCGDERDQREWVRDTEIHIDANPDSVRIETDYEKLEERDSRWHSFWSSCTARPLVHYKISMPATARLDIRDHRSKIDVSGLKGDVRLNTHRGAVTLSHVSGRVDLQTHRGQAWVEFARFSSGSRFETHRGDIEILVPKEASFDLEADMGRHGQLTSDFDLPSPRLSRYRRSEAIQGSVNGGGPQLQLSTHSGSFRLKRS